MELRPEGGGGASPFPIRGGALAAGASGLQARLVHPSKVLPGKLARCACLRKAQRLTEGGVGGAWVSGAQTWGELGLVSRSSKTAGRWP